MSIFEQKRKQTRKALIYYFEIIDIKTDTLLGRVVDITTDGVQIVTEEILKPNSQFDLKLMLPEEIQGLNEARFQARCVRSEKDPHSSYYYSGLRFLSIEPEHTKLIEYLISDYEF